MIVYRLLRRCDPKVRVWVASGILELSLIGWPVSALTFARDEPPWVLGLSWAAIILTMLDVLSTADVRKETA